jgi:hypothetical protein
MLYHYGPRKSKSTKNLIIWAPVMNFQRFFLTKFCIQMKIRTFFVDTVACYHLLLQPSGRNIMHNQLSYTAYIFLFIIIFIYENTFNKRIHNPKYSVLHNTTFGTTGYYILSCYLLFLLHFLSSRSKSD